MKKKDNGFVWISAETVRRDIRRIKRNVRRKEPRMCKNERRFWTDIGILEV